MERLISKLLDIPQAPSCRPARAFLEEECHGTHGKEEAMRSSRGFTLIEALMALVLISLMVVSIFGVFPQTRKGLAHSGNRVRAALLGKSLIEEQRCRGFDAIAARTGIYSYQGVNNGAPFSQSIDYSVNVQNVGADKKQVWIVLTWPDQDGTGRLTLETVVVKL